MKVFSIESTHTACAFSSINFKQNILKHIEKRIKLNSFQKDHLPNDTTEYKQEVAKKERKKIFPVCPDHLNWFPVSSVPNNFIKGLNEGI